MRETVLVLKVENMSLSNIISCVLNFILKTVKSIVTQVKSQSLIFHFNLKKRGGNNNKLNINLTLNDNRLKSRFICL